MQKNHINFLYRLLVSSYALSTFSEGIILPVYAIFVQKVGGDILNAGEAMGIFLLTGGVFTVLVHRIRRNQKQRIALLVSGWLIWVVGIISYLLISNIWILFVSQVLTAIGNSLADPVLIEELSHHTDKRLEEFEWGIFDGSRDLVSGIAAIIGGLIISIYSFTTLIYLMIAAATISFLMILYYVVRTRSAIGGKLIRLYAQLNY